MKELNKKLYEYYKNNKLQRSIIFNIKSNRAYCFYSVNTFKDLRSKIKFRNYNSNMLYSLNNNSLNNHYTKYCLYIFDLLLLCIIYKK